jgi:hypothetical protein
MLTQCHQLYSVGFDRHMARSFEKKNPIRNSYEDAKNFCGKPTTVGNLSTRSISSICNIFALFYSVQTSGVAKPASYA